MDSLASMVQAYRSAPTLEVKRAASEAIVRDIHPRLWQFLRARLNSDHEAEDILQETFAGIFKSLPLFRGESSSDVSGFCFGIAKHKLNTFLARKSRSLEDTRIDDNLREMLGSQIAVEPEDPFKHEELYQALAILKASRPDCIRYFELRFILSMNYRAMGELLGMGEDEITYKLRKCLERLRKFFPQRTKTMPDDPSNAVAKLTLLGERVLAGVAKLHPPSAKTFATVNEIVTEQWQREQQVNQMLSQNDPTKRQDQAQEQSLGQGHKAELGKGLSDENDPGKERPSSQSKSTGQSKDHDSDHDQGHDNDHDHDHGHGH